MFLERQAAALAAGLLPVIALAQERVPALGRQDLCPELRAATSRAEIARAAEIALSMLLQALASR